jgi:hypothetical protein
MPPTVDTLPIPTDSAFSLERLRDRPAASQESFSVADLCRRYKVGADKIYGFIRRGELIAINLAANLSSRPHWRVTHESVEAFESRRSSAPPPKPARRRRRPVARDYYPDLTKPRMRRARS